jgi:hypothetical protein
MRTLLFISFLLTTTSALGQMTLQDIEDKVIVQRIEFIKTKTDSFLLTHFKKNIRPKFQFDFLSCGYFRGESRSIYQFLNSDKPEPDDLNSLTHFYIFFDKGINLMADIGIWFYQYQDIKMEFKTISDSLKYEALNTIYNKELITKIKTKIIDLKLKRPYFIIQVYEKRRTFDIILKDKSLPHNYFLT